VKSNKFWIAVFAVILLLAGVSSTAILGRRTQGVVANVYRDGVCVHSVDLSQVTGNYSLSIVGAVENTISVEHGRIRVSSATCPDQICVHQGYISNSIVPIVCLPNALVIQIESAPVAGIDAITQ